MGAASIIESAYIKTLVPIPNDVVSHDVYFLKPAHAIGKVFIDKSIYLYYRRHDNNLSIGLNGTSSYKKKSTDLHP